MNADLLENSVHALWDSDQAKPLRAFLASRKLDNPQILEMFDVPEPNRSNITEFKLALYDAEIYYIDSQFGRVVDALKERGLYDRTVIAVTSDHGEGLGDHDWWGHRILYQEQIEVPLIFRLPGGPSGMAVSALSRTIDIAPTILDWLGVLPAGRTEGRSLRPLMEGRADEPRIAYADQINLYDSSARMLDERPTADLLYSACDGEWKLILRPRHPGLHELYNLSEDPGETVNLYDDEPAVVKRLTAFLEESGGFVNEPFGEGTDEEAKRRLEALGYVGN